MRPYDANEEDRSDVQDLLRACGLPAIGTGAQISNFVVMRDKAGLLGCAGLDRCGQVALLHSVAVAKRARSAGLGELLIAAKLVEARICGMESVVIETADAAAYFSRLGFEQIERASMAVQLPGTKAAQHIDSVTLMQAAL